MINMQTVLYCKSMYKFAQLFCFPFCSVDARSESDEKPQLKVVVPDGTTPSIPMMHAGIDHPGIQITELLLNIEDLRRYSRQQRQENTSRLKDFGRESTDQAFERTVRGLRTSVDDETALTWVPKVAAGKDMIVTPQEAEQRWREHLRNEAELRADNYAAAVAEYQKKKPKRHCGRY